MRQGTKRRGRGGGGGREGGGGGGQEKRLYTKRERERVWLPVLCLGGRPGG